MERVMGYVEAVFTAPGAGLPVVRRARVEARPGAGLDGDRYASGTGHWSGDNKVGRDLTLIEAEVVDALSAELGMSIDAAELRRNVVTRGVRLNDLVGVRFRIGGVVAEGTRLCEPCDYLARLTGRAILEPLVHRGGLRANVLSAGAIVEGATIDLEIARARVS
jgi:MOSC domain-containing protein YiiM